MSSEKIVNVAPQWRLATWYSDLSTDTLNKLKSINALLQKHNREYNLVSQKTLAFADIIHFADCILAVRAVLEDRPQIDQIYDFGSGNGFPGLIFAAMAPKVNVVLVDTDGKKCEYLKLCAAECGLSNVTVVNSTVEALPQESVRYAITRGMANISKTILVARKCVASKGQLYHMKTEQWGLELSQLPTQLCSVWTPSLVKEYNLPIGEVRFALVKTEKIA